MVIGVRIILLGLNAARYCNHIRMSDFTTVLGIIALITDVGELFSLALLISGRKEPFYGISDF